MEGMSARDGKDDEPPQPPFMADPDMQQLFADSKPEQARTQKLLADVTPNAEQTALLLAELETNRRRQEVETVARRLATDAEFGRAVFAELARIDPARFASLTKL
jgi:hypothetical protein